MVEGCLGEQVQYHSLVWSLCEGRISLQAFQTMLMHKDFLIQKPRAHCSLPLHNAVEKQGAGHILPCWDMLIGTEAL